MGIYEKIIEKHFERLGLYCDPDCIYSSRGRCKRNQKNTFTLPKNAAMCSVGDRFHESTFEEDRGAYGQLVRDYKDDGIISK